MTGERAADHGGQYTLQEADEICRTRSAAAGPPMLTVEDVVLLLLYADPRPMRGGGGPVRQALLAAAGVLRELGVEPALFGGGPAGPRSAHIDAAIGDLVFSNKVRMSGDRESLRLGIEITPRGRDAIRERYESLPPAVRIKLSQKRAEWDALERPRARPPAVKDGAPAHKKALSKGGPRAASGEPAVRRTAKEWPARGGGSGGAAAARRQEHTARGNRLLSEGRYEEAYEAYRLAKGRGAPGADLELGMAMSLSAMGRHKDALRHCRAAIREGPSWYECYAAMGHCLDRLGRHAEALPCHLRAARLDPGGALARRNASFSLFQMGRYREALQHAKSAAAAEPKHPAAHVGAAACASMLGASADAVRLGRRAIKEAPDSVDSYLSLIIPLFGPGRHEEVLELCDQAAAADCLDPRPHFAGALALRELGRHEEALSRCQRSVDLDPSDPEVRDFMCQMLVGQGRLSEALPHCEAAVSARPDSPSAHSNMGAVLAGLGRHDRALACFGKALRIDPGQPAPRYNRALSLQATGSLRRALVEYKRVVGLDPGNAGAHNNAGTVLSALGRDAEALAHFDRALDLDPGSVVMHCNKGIALQILGLHREALEHFDRALELDPGNADAHVERASCLAELGLPDREIGAYAREALGPVEAPAAPAAHRRRPAAKDDAAGGDRAQLVRRLLSLDESDTLEFKSWPGSRPGRPKEPGKMEETIARELCSLANTKGGDLLVGVGDGGEAEGLAPNGGLLPRKERGKMLEWAANVIADYFGADRGGLFDCEIVDVGGLDILHCAVAAPRDGPTILKKRLGGRDDFFVRVGSTCRPLGSEDMLRHVRARWPEWAVRPRPMEQPAIGPTPGSAPRAGGLGPAAAGIRALVENAMTMVGKL